MNPNAQRKKPTNTTRVDLKRLEQELHAAQPRNRQQRRATTRSEADGLSRVTSQHARSRPINGGAA